MNRFKFLRICKRIIREYPIPLEFIDKVEQAKRYKQVREMQLRKFGNI